MVHTFKILSLNKSQKAKKKIGNRKLQNPEKQFITQKKEENLKAPSFT